MLGFAILFLLLFLFPIVSLLFANGVWGEMDCLDSPLHFFYFFAVLANGSPSQFFSASRELRQGDPISPLLFLLIMEVFTMVNSATTVGLISGFSVARLNEFVTDVSALLFADDTIIFCDNDCEQIVNLRCILIWFEAVSRLRVNLSKSSIVPVGQWTISNCLQVF